MSERKAGVASPEELKAFVASAGSRLVVVDTRNPDASVEPGDQKSLAVAGLPSDSYRPQARHLIYDRETKTMSLPEVAKDTPIITHCGGGGRGQKAKEYLECQWIYRRTEWWWSEGDRLLGGVWGQMNMNQLVVLPC